MAVSVGTVAVPLVIEPIGVATAVAGVAGASLSDWNLGGGSPAAPAAAPDFWRAGRAGHRGYGIGSGLRHSGSGMVARWTSVHPDDRMSATEVSGQNMSVLPARIRCRSRLSARPRDLVC